MALPLLFPKREVKFNQISQPAFLLTKKVPISVERFTAGTWVGGRWVEGNKTTLTINANVQPLKGEEILALSESDRHRDSIKVYSTDVLNTVNEVGQESADIIIWNSKRYKAIKTQTYQMGVLDHTKTVCYRLPETPDEMAGVTGNG